MRKTILLLISLLITACGQPTRNILNTPTAQQPAFPNAVGFGSDTIGGRGGVICQVTNLNNSGVGSFRDCVSQGNRIVIFKVSGIIQLTSHINISNPFVTILGQTSPEGIVLKGAGIQVRTHDVIVRGLMCRTGSESTGAPLEDRTCFIVNNGGGVDPYNVVFDHNSAQWGTDELGSIWNGATDVTFSNNIFAEPLNCAGHPSGCHPYPLLIGFGAKDITIVNNLFANGKWRNPSIQEDTRVEVINNLLYSWGTGSIIVQGGGTGSSFINVIGNYGKPTLCSSVKLMLIDGANTGSKVYTDDWNNVSGSNSLIANVKSLVPVFVGSGIIATSKEQTYINVLANAGARNDSVDQRIKNNVINGTLPNGKCWIDSPSEVGGWIAPVGTPYLDSDNDGLPDSFENVVGNVNPASISPSGYAWIEEWANQFYGNIIPVTSTPSTVTSPVTFTSAPSLTPTLTRTPTPTRTPTVTASKMPTIVLSSVPVTITPECKDYAHSRVCVFQTP